MIDYRIIIYFAVLFLFIYIVNCFIFAYVRRIALHLEKNGGDVIEEKEGHWIRIKRKNNSDVFRCSVCGIVAFDETETCLRCKSKMDGGKAE